MKVVEVKVYEQVEHRGFIAVPDDFDATNEAHIDAMSELFCDRHEAFDEFVIAGRELLVADTFRTHANDYLELDR